MAINPNERRKPQLEAGARAGMAGIQDLNAAEQANNLQQQQALSDTIARSAAANAPDNFTQRQVEAAAEPGDTNAAILNTIQGNMARTRSGNSAALGAASDLTNRQLGLLDEQAAAQAADPNLMLGAWDNAQSLYDQLLGMSGVGTPKQRAALQEQEDKLQQEQRRAERQDLLHENLVSSDDAERRIAGAASSNKNYADYVRSFQGQRLDEDRVKELEDAIDLSSDDRKALERHRMALDWENMNDFDRRQIINRGMYYYDTPNSDAKIAASRQEYDVLQEPLRREAELNPTAEAAQESPGFIERIMSRIIPDPSVEEQNQLIEDMVEQEVLRDTAEQALEEGRSLDALQGGIAARLRDPRALLLGRRAVSVPQAVAENADELGQLLRDPALPGVVGEVADYANPMYTAGDLKRARRSTTGAVNNFLRGLIGGGR